MVNVIEQKDPEEFVYPQDIATGVGPDARMMRYGGLTKREWVATMLMSGWLAGADQRESIDISRIISYADEILAELNKPAEPDSSIYPLSRAD